MNIFVAKLNYATTSDELRSTFEQFGEVSSAKVVMDRETNRSKGFAFVEMPNDDEASEAIDQLDNSNLDGNTIVVKKARPKEETGSGGGFNRGGGSGGYNRNSGGDGGGGYNRSSGGDSSSYNKNSGGGGYNKNSGGGGGNNRGGGGGYDRNSRDRDSSKSRGNDKYDRYNNDDNY